MQAEKLFQKIDQHEIDADQLAALIPENQPLQAVIDGIYSEKPCVNYACVEALRKVSRAHPRLLYAYFNTLVDLLRTSQPLIRTEIIYILANLAQVDTQNKIDEFLDAYFEPLDGPNLLTAMSVVKASLRVLAAKPYLGKQIAGELLRVQSGKYENEECRRLIYEEVLDTLQIMRSQPRSAGMAN
ncbi:MAG: hypothetical protein WEA61_05540 [Anaerolineales bacterium]